MFNSAKKIMKMPVNVVLVAYNVSIGFCIGSYAGLLHYKEIVRELRRMQRLGLSQEEINSNLSEFISEKILRYSEGLFIRKI